MDNISNIISTNNLYKNEKTNTLNKINDNTNNNSSSDSLISNNKLYFRKNTNINESDLFMFNNDAQIHDSNKIASLEKKNNFKYRITRVNIDSKHRNIIPQNILSNNNISLNNPFNLTQNSNIITINYINHGLTINDKITISNVNSPEFLLNTLNFYAGSNFIKIIHPNHGLQLFNTSYIYSPYYILISDIINSNNNLTFLQNIPLNVLNNYQIVYLNIDNSNNFNPNEYYIKIPLTPTNDATYTLTYKVTYMHLYGIPIKNINANYPVNASSVYGFQTVHNIIDNNTFQIVVDYIANNTILSCGGNNICINQITNTINGYPNNNHYIISLNKTFYNVMKIKLISTEFPNTAKIINDSPLSRQNNLLYFQILDDGEFIYKINITPGNYDINGLITEIQNNIALLNRVSHPELQNTNTYTYLSTLLSTVQINVNSSRFTVQFYGQITIDNPFSISASSSLPNVYILEVNHPNHLLQVGTQILIQNSLDIGTTPNYVINSSFNISEIIDKNTYKIQLPKYNPLSNSSTVSNIGGGLSVTIRYPLQSRLLFDQAGTIGNIIGFRNIGQANSITSWNYTITNNTPYINDLLVDSVGNSINSSIINNYINLNGDNYIILANPLFKNSIDTGGISGVFAKLLLAGPPGYILFNQFIQLGDEFNDGIQSLSELEWYFYFPDGTLYSFNNIDHSFTIEIYEKIIENNFININSKSTNFNTML